MSVTGERVRADAWQPGVEQPEVAVDAGDGGDGGARIAIEPALVDGEGGAQAEGPVHLRAVALGDVRPDER